MMWHERIEITTDASGAATAYSRPFSGRLAGLYVDNGAGGSALAATADLTITVEETGAPVLTITDLSADAWYAPGIPVYGTSGTAALYAGGGTAVLSPLPIDGRIKIVLSQGGATKTGYITAYVEP